MKRLRIYTKAGDGGNTSLYGGKIVAKSDVRVEAYGTVDELNSLLGFAYSKIKDESSRFLIEKVQKDLFLVGSYLAGANVMIDSLSGRVLDMEKDIDEIDGKIPPLRNFILPQGSEASSILYLSRAVARRAERQTVRLGVNVKLSKALYEYMNRLSDFLFVLARYLNFQKGIPETVWKI